MSGISPYESPFEAPQGLWEHEHEEHDVAAWTESLADAAFEDPAPGFLHRCAPGEGPPASVPDPEGIGPHPLVLKGTSPRYSRNPSVGHAQLALNRFLATTVAGFGGCIDRTPARVAYMQQLRAQLRANRQDPLAVDCRFGPNTEAATKIFQACHGLVRDGKIGPVTWTHLRRFETDAPGPRANPPDTECSGPTPGTRSEAEGYESFEPFYEDQVARVRPRPRANLAFAQGGSTATGHFLCGAGTQAGRMLAIGTPVAGTCQQQVGATTYSSGAEIIASISAARTCVGQRVGAVHIFSHSGTNGVYAVSGQSVGLYITTDPTSRAAGARTVTDIPTADLSEDVVFVLHGCNTAAGTGSFAQALFDHLAGSLRNPRVFGHVNSGCAGRDNSWREFSTAARTGRRLRSLAPTYTAVACCGPVATPGATTEAFDAYEPESSYESYESYEPESFTDEAPRPCCAACAGR